jgi:hypothetical protein
MSLKVMNHLGLNIRRTYRNVCGIDSRAIPVCGLIKDLKVNLATYPDISLLMDVVVIISIHDYFVLDVFSFGS